MILAWIGHIFREFLYGLRRSLKSHLAPVFLMAVALFILGLFLVGTSNLRELIHLAHAKVGIAVYLSTEATEPQREAITAMLPKLDGVKSARYVDEEQALDRFRSELGGRSYLLDGVDGNPLPASFELEIWDDWKTADRMADIASRVGELHGVDSVIYGEGWVGRLERWIYFFVTIDVFLGAVLGLSALLVVGNTMKLALESRRDTIDVLRNVGASRTQIRAPFMLEGMVLGLAAAGLAFLLLRQTHLFAVERLAGVLFLGTMATLGFFALGAILGAGGALLSLRKYLKVRRA